ncbi:MAG: chorismate synthase [Cardiobacteriaceae bacterium]|nr:chorismate synthase [Cardiobacteriaceae bacterium]
MSGNSIGKNLVFTSFGESHGAAIGGILDGAPANIPINLEKIQAELDRRRPGTSRFVTPRNESDTVEILSGIFHGKTTGTPIGFLIRNQNQQSRDYSDIAEKFRPGHADFTYFHKYGIRDYRGGGRSSARETAARVAAGAIVKQILGALSGVVIHSYLSQIGEIKLDFESWEEVTKNPFNCPNAKQVADLEKYLSDIRRLGDSIGAEITLVAENVPIGLGEPIFDRLDAEIAYAVMGINAVKAVEIGDGKAAVYAKGSEFRDEITAENGFLTNHAGGILGGISTGQNIIVRAAFKPTSSILVSGKTIDIHGKNTEISTHGRHDPCVALRACPIMEAMIALVLGDHLLRQRGQNGNL